MYFFRAFFFLGPKDLFYCARIICIYLDNRCVRQDIFI